MIKNPYHKFRVYEQLERSDCGLTCVRMMARHFGKKVPLKTLRELCETNRAGISIADILGAFSAVKMRGEAVKIGIEDFYRMPLPAILYWNQNHFVVAYKADKKRRLVWLADPAEGRVKISDEELRRGWLHESDKGIAILAGPEDDFKQQKFSSASTGMRGLFSTLKSTIAQNKGRFLFIVILSLLIMAADVAVPLLFQRTVDEGIMLKDLGLVWLLILAQLALFAGNFAASGLMQLITTKLGLKLNLEMVNTYLEKLIRLPLSFFDCKVNSDLIQKIDDQSRLKDFILSLPQTLLLMTVNVVVFSAMLCWYSPHLFGIFILLSLLEIAWSIAFLRRRKALDYAHFNRMSENRNNIYELVNGMPEIKGNNAQEIKLREWRDTQNKINRLSLKGALLNLASGGGSTFLARIKDLCVTGICAGLVIAGDMSIGIMMTVGYIAGRLSGPFRSMIDLGESLQRARISYERLDEVLSSNTAESNGNRPDIADISLTDVSFRYPGSNSPLVLRNINLTIPAGKTTALVGESGCGKTTLIKLLLGFYHPSSGSLKTGDTDLRLADLDWWLTQCGVVMQSGYLFSGTIMANIALCDETPDAKRVKSAAQIAGIDKFITSLPMGYHTKIGPTGMELSGGQRQRLLIARAVYKNSPILFLDEATSSLDANTEKEIIENLQRHSSNKTVIVAAHRLSTVQNADLILFLKDGQIAESGNHNQLIARKGDYYNLVHNQLQLAD